MMQPSALQPDPTLRQHLVAPLAEYDRRTPAGMIGPLPSSLDKGAFHSATPDGLRLIAHEQTTQERKHGRLHTTVPLNAVEGVAFLGEGAC